MHPLPQHRNAFMIHPGIPGVQGHQNLEPKAWYKPTAAATWPQTPGPNTKLAGVVLPAGQDSCLDCHDEADKRRPPEIVKAITPRPGINYCDAVLSIAINKTDAAQRRGVARSGNHKTHTDFLLKGARRREEVGRRRSAGWAPLARRPAQGLRRRQRANLLAHRRPDFGRVAEVHAVVDAGVRHFLDEVVDRGPRPRRALGEVSRLPTRSARAAGDLGLQHGTDRRRDSAVRTWILGVHGGVDEGVHEASRSVASLPSRSPLRIAVTGRQKL